MAEKLLWLDTVKLVNRTHIPLQRVMVEGKDILLVKVKDKYYALHNRCPHLGCPLHTGSLDGYLLKCPCHDWVFDVRDGAFTLASEIAVTRYPVRVREETVQVSPTEME